MEYATIVAQPRTVIGKKVKQLRREGILPANVFGRGLDSKSIQLDAREFVRIARASGVRSMYKLAVEGESDPRYVFIRGLMREGGMGQPRHVDFHQVDLNKEIDVTVTLLFINESAAVRDLAGTLQTQAHTITLRTMPLNVPEHVEADLSILRNFDATLTAGDITVPDGVAIVDSPDTLIAKVSPPRIRLDDAGEAIAEDVESAEAAQAASDADVEEAEAEGESGD